MSAREQARSRGVAAAVLRERYRTPSPNPADFRKAIRIYQLEQQAQEHHSLLLLSVCLAFSIGLAVGVLLTRTYG